MIEPLALQSEALAGLDLTQPPAAPPTTDPAPEAPASQPAGASASGAPPTATPTPSPAPAASDWRSKIAGDDKQFADKVLSRYSDEAAFGKAHRALLQRLSSGELREAPKPFPDKGTDQEKAAWLQSQGIPDKPEAYQEKFAPPAGVVFGEADKPALDRLFNLAHKNKWAPDVVNSVAAAYHNELQAATNAREEADSQFRQQAEDTLRTDWGADYRPNINAIDNLLNGMPHELQQRFIGGRTADGRNLGTDPGVLKWLASIARELNPAATILPSGVTVSAFKSRLDTLEGMVKDAESEYYTGVNAKALQREHLELLDKQEKMQARGRAA